MARPTKYRCTICTHVYDPAEGDPAEGDPERNIPPGTAFKDIPATWVCPDCGASKADFEPMQD